MSKVSLRNMAMLSHAKLFAIVALVALVASVSSIWSESQMHKMQKNASMERSSMVHASASTSASQNVLIPQHPVNILDVPTNRHVVVDHMVVVVTAVTVIVVVTVVVVMEGAATVVVTDARDHGQDLDLRTTEEIATNISCLWRNSLSFFGLTMKRMTMHERFCLIFVR